MPVIGPVLLLIASTLGVDVVTLDGVRRQGEIVSVNDAELALDMGGTAQAVPLRELQAAEFAPVDEPPPWEMGDVEVRFADGTRIVPRSVTIEKGRFSAAAPHLGELKCDATLTASLRFAAADDALLATWNELLTREARMDLVVVQKGDNLDFIPAVIGAVTADSISFTVSGRTTTVPRARVFGLIYTARDAATKPPVCLVELRTREVVPARTLSLKDGITRVQSPAGLDLSIPVQQLARLDFSQGKVRSLADLVDLKGAKFEPQWPVSFVEREFALRGDGRNSSGDPLLLGGKRYSQGLYVHSGFVVRANLNKQYRRLQAQFGLDENGDEHRRRIRPTVKVSLTGDTKLLFEKNIAWNDSAPHALDLDVTGVRLLELRIDSTTSPSRFGACEVVDFVDARLVK